jgi:hypothetical protein
MRSKNNEFKYFISFIVLLLLINIPYCIYFFGAFSQKSEDWSNYSSYFSGLLNPLVSFVGLYLLLKEYVKSIQIRSEDNVIKILDKIEQDLLQVFERDVFFHTMPGKENDRINLVYFLRFKSNVDFLEILVERGNTKFNSKLSFEIIQIINALYLLFINLKKLPVEYIEYYKNKYFYVLSYIFSEEYYAYQIINTEKCITEDNNIQKAINYLKPIWIDEKKYT